MGAETRSHREFLRVQYTHIGKLLFTHIGNTPPRELAGIEEAMKNLKADRGVIVTYNQEETIDDTLSIASFWKYF